MEFRGLPQAPSAPVSFHVASLLESFSIIPSAAAPAILDCILASSSLSSSALFSSLLEAIPAVVQPPQSNYILSYMTSLCHLIGKTGSQYDSMSQFIWRVFLPLLKASPDESELLSQMDALFCEVVSKIQPWELMGVTLVPFCLRSLRFSLGICESEDLATYQWKVDNIDQDYNSIPLGALPLQSGCRVLKSLLLSAMRCKEMLVLGQSSAEEEDILVCFINNLTWDLSRLVLGVHMQSSEHRSSAVRILLPVIIRCLNELSPVSVCVQGSLCRLSRVSFSKELWNCCSTLFGLGHLERLDALSILSIYFSIFFDNDKFDNQSIENTKLFVAIERKEFWEEIRKGLVDNDSAMRKQALYILKILLKHYSLVEIHDAGCFSGDSRMRLEDDKNNLDDIAMSVGATKRERWADREARSLGVGEVYHTMDQFLNSYGRWKVFILLYEMLEEYGTHLVEAAWSHQVSLLFQSSLPDSSSLSCESYISQMENPVARFTWLAVLWERGFSHENPQVRCLILASFLCMDWGNLGNSIHLIPKAFVLGSLTRALNDVSHHNDFGVKGVYTSKTIERASKFYHEFSHNLTLSESASFISSLALVATSNSFGRAGLMALASCIASAACCCDTHPANEECSATEEVKSTEERCLPFDAAELLDALGIVIERSKQHFNPNYRRRVCEDVLNAASSLTNVMDIEFDLLLHFIAKVPREFTDNGSLRVIVQKWFLKCNYSRMYVLENLIDFPMRFIVQMQLSESSTSFDDDDVESWGREAQRWARVLFLVLTEAKHLEAIFMCLEKYSSSLCNQNSCREWVPIKLFILFLALIEELQIGFSSVVHLSVDKYRTEYNIINQLGRETLPEISIYYKTAGAFHRLLEHLVPFTKLASSVFWSVPAAEDLQLPPSIKGRLGGPSQRRLASVITSRVLQAIFSLRTVASISSWCNELESGDFSDTFSFLWTFSWKAVQSSIYHTEVGAEISLAMYEALAYVLKVFPNNFTKLNLDFVLSYNETQWSDREAIHLLDPLVLNFLDNMKKLLANGLLTRSRRAVLMNWKWICLASLLSIPSNVMAYSHISSAVSLLSHSTLRSVFLDIVDSLENAGENSLLPMLKSVRLVLGLLCSSATLSSIHQCEVTDEMMQLAQSSWILHVNCNKRRVAPIAALLSSVLHQSLFSHLAMHDSKDNKPGPLKWFVGKLLDDGKRSPRTIRLAALHLTGLWLLYPATIKYYIKELKLLTLYGSVAFDEDFEAELSENHEAEIEVSILAQSPDQEFTEVFINTEMYARASVAALFYKLANFTLEDGEREKNDAISSGKFFLLEMLDSVVNEQDLAKELYKKYSGVHRRKVRAWQMICILSHFVEDDIVGKVTSDLHICLHRNNLPAVRQYLETFAIQIYLKFPSLAEEQLIPIFHNYNLRPQALSSYVFIAANVIRHESDLVVQRIHLNELFPAIIPLLTSHHHSLRGFTQLLVYHVLCKLWPIMINNGSEVASLAEKCFGDLRLYLAENTDCVKLRVSMEGLLNAFDPKLSATPSGVFDVQKEGSEFECVPISLMEKVMDFLNGVREDLRFSMAKDAMIIKNEHFDATNMWKDMAELPDGSSKEPQAMLKDINLDFQRKITLQKEVRPSIDHDSIAMASDVEFPRLLSDLEKEDQLFGSVLQVRNQALERIRQQKQQFILVASLIDRIPNLAGLARTCEIFKAAGLVFADASILQDKQFQLISVTAEKWVPIIEVPISNIKGFLEKKRKEGFSILGLEQTANSTRLDQYSFPTKTVLVLGREKEGIPVDIIHVLDGCVEIPQLGIIRSLNVHVSGAIALWEYTRQQRHKL